MKNPAHPTPDQLVVFDTTLRDGEQSAGAAMSAADKLKIALQLERLRVDVIEAGFPAASDGDFQAVQNIAAQIKDSIVCGLARANDNDIRRAGEAVQKAERPRVHTFHRHLPHSYGEKTRDEPRRSPQARGQSRPLRPRILRTMWNSPPKTPGALKRIFCVRSWRRP